MRLVDAWYGIDSGCARKVSAVLTEELENGCAIIKITDQDLLNEIGWDEKQDGFFGGKYEKLSKDRWVSYDAFKWSEIGEVSDSELVDAGCDFLCLCGVYDKSKNNKGM